MPPRAQCAGFLSRARAWTLLSLRGTHCSRVLLSMCIAGQQNKTGIYVAKNEANRRYVSYMSYCRVITHSPDRVTSSYYAADGLSWHGNRCGRSVKLWRPFAQPCMRDDDLFAAAGSGFRHTRALLVSSAPRDIPPAQPPTS